MQTGVDRSRYPRTEQYLASLPDGMGSYPDCKTSPDFLTLLWPELEKVLQEPNTSSLLTDKLGAALAPGTWIPTTRLVLSATLLRDRCFKDDATYSRYMFDRCCVVYRQPLYRALMFVLSPNLVIMGSAKRWEKFYRGSQLETVKLTKNSAELKLTFPSRLFPAIWVQTLGTLFEAAIFCAGAKSPRVTARDVTDTSAMYDCEWT